jgi:hypothetical protein
MSEPLMGWKVTIVVPQPNGREHRHVWVAAIADEQAMRERLMLPALPCEADVEPLSPQEAAGFALEPGEVRRVA